MAKIIGMPTPELLDALRALGIEPNDTRRVVIDIAIGEPLTVYVERYADQHAVNVLAVLAGEPDVRVDFYAAGDPIAVVPPGHTPCIVPAGHTLVVGLPDGATDCDHAEAVEHWRQQAPDMPVIVVAGAERFATVTAEPEPIRADPTRPISGQMRAAGSTTPRRPAVAFDSPPSTGGIRNA